MHEALVWFKSFWILLILAWFFGFKSLDQNKSILLLISMFSGNIGIFDMENYAWRIGIIEGLC